MTAAVTTTQIHLPEDLSGWLQGIRFWTEFTVRLYETDANGHASQLTYFGYQETAIGAYLASLGFGQLMASQSDRFVVMGEQYCRFISEVRYGDLLRVGVQTVHIGRSSFRVEYAFVRSDGTLAAIGATSVILAASATHKPLPLPDDLIAGLRSSGASEPAGPGPVAG